MNSEKLHSGDNRDEGATRAVLVSVVLPDVTDAQSRASLDELERLASTLGLSAVARLTQRRETTGAASVLGAGKLRRLARYTDGSGVVPLGAAKRRKGTPPKEDDARRADEFLGDDSLASQSEGERHANDEDFDDASLDAYVFGDEGDEGADPLPGDEADAASRARVVLFDHDLTPSQLRNVEGATSAEVLDRSSLILRIFQRHARTREAKLQVEIAHLKYLAPRLRATGASRDRQRGGIGGKGAGESALELDRRRVRDRIAELEQRLVIVRREANTQRARRSVRQTIALLGYTNAGKSSLMRRLTGSEVLVQDQLFATLDTTIRQLKPATRPPILVSDTVGFIKKLPHDLVASFRSTLEEARDAALLLHVVDASDPDWRAHVEVTRSVVGEVGAGENPTLMVFNKADRLDTAARLALAEDHPDAIVMSALRPSDISALYARIVTFFERKMVDEELFVPYTQQRLVHIIHESCRVLGEVHDEVGTRIAVRAAPALIDELRKSI
ncbi:MAG: GTPase HflX [Deltaproteobacteria bacterium]|nr:GTPase HflX [Deltaproteobacteria bacterium]